MELTRCVAQDVTTKLKLEAELHETNQSLRGRTRCFRKRTGSSTSSSTSSPTIFRSRCAR